MVTGRREGTLDVHTGAQAPERPKSGGEKTSSHLASGSGRNQGVTDRQQFQEKGDDFAQLQDGSLLDHMPFQKEVDFHHQIAYAFEKSYRLRENQKPEAVVKAANHEITQLLSSQKWILQLDPLIVFYCLYFSTFYRNEEALAFLKELIQKLGFKSSEVEKQDKKKLTKVVSKQTIAVARSPKSGNNEFDKTKQI